MSTEMHQIDPFGLPDDFNQPNQDEKQSLSLIMLEHDLHDNYDLLSQPLGNPTGGKGSVRNESR